MNRPPEIEQIEARFGRTFTTLEAIGPYMAFRTSIDEPQVTISPAGSEFPLDRVIQTAGEHCLWCHSLGYAVFVGLPDDVGPPSLYAIAGADPIRLMAVFDVGNHNDFTGDTPARARRYMAALLTTDPFVPYFADPAGFKVRFIDHVTAARARDIAGAVLEFDPDAVALGEALDDIEEAGDIDIRDALGRVIHRRQRLELWWDQRRHLQQRRSLQSGLSALKDLCRNLGFSEAANYLWRSKFGGMSVSDAKRRKELAIETAADSPLETEVTREVLRKKW